MSQRTWVAIVFSLAIILLVLSFIQGAGLPENTLRSKAGNGLPLGPDTARVIEVAIGDSNGNLANATPGTD